MVLMSSLALTFFPDTQASIVSIVLSNVALSFIVDLDNRVGVMLASQQQVAASGQESKDTAWNGCGMVHHDGQQIWHNLCGYLYMSIVGILLLMEPIMLSPGVIYSVCGVVMVLLGSTGDFEPGGGQPVPVNGLYNFIRQAGYTPSNWLLMTNTYSTPPPALFCCATILATSLLILLMFSKVLPQVKAKWWGLTLLLLQISLYVGAMFASEGWRQLVYAFFAPRKPGTVSHFQKTWAYFLGEGRIPSK